MIKLLIFFFVGLIPSASFAQAPSQSAPPPQRALDLTQCYQLAKKQSETLRIETEQIDQAEQQFRQVFASVLPNISFQASQKYQQRNAGGGGLTPTSSPQVNFLLTQPLFSGFREYAAMRSFKHEGMKNKLLLDFAARQLFQNVAGAFYLVLSLEKNLEDARTLRDFTNDRAGELRQRERLGKSRVSEVLTVESQVETLDAQIESIKGQIAAARELLSFLIGEDASDAALADDLPALPSVESEEALLRKALGRADVQAADEEAKAQWEQVQIAKGAWYPTASFTGDYYLKRIPFYQSIHWDAMFGASLPIFSGGGMVAQSKQAESQWRAAEDAAGLAYRQARSQIRTAYLAFASAVAQSRTLAEAYRKAKDSYRLQTREYRLGIVDNLTVLQALNDMQSAKLGMDQTAIQIKIDYIQLKVATEEMP